MTSPRAQESAKRARGGWTAADIPDQSGRTVVVTGASGGVGLQTAKALASRAAAVILACRDLAKAEQAADRIRADAPGARVRVVRLDLASLGSVREAASEIRATCSRLDTLINNAGVMDAPQRRTEDGFELTFATNHLGHFALTGLLLGRMQGREDARVVTVSSTAHKLGKIDFDDLQRRRHYFRWTAYGQSKLANLLFARELDRRLRAAGSTVSSMAAHPGYSATNLQSASPPALDRIVMAVSNHLFAQSAEMGALPELYAATRPNLDGGLFVGPDGPNEQRGYPKVVSPSKAGRNEATADRLWAVSEELTGVSYDFGPNAKT